MFLRKWLKVRLSYDTILLMDSFTCSFRMRDQHYSMRELHSHEEHELYFLSSGERRYFIAGEVVTVRAKDFIYIKPGVLHRTSYSSAKAHTRYVAHFPSSWLDEVSSSMPPFFHCKDCPGVEVLFARLQKEAEDVLPLSGELARALATEILIDTWRYASAEDRDELMTDGRIGWLTGYIAAHLDGDLSLGALASLVGLSPNHLSSLFHKASGMRLSDYIRSVRITRSCEVLKRGGSVSEAASAAGFSDSAYFKDVFRRTLDISPSAWKKAQGI